MENNGHPNGDLRNPHVRHEPGDVDAPYLSKFALSLSALVLVFMVGLWGLFEFLKNRAMEMGRPESPSAMVNVQKQPPEPRLQAHGAQDMRALRAVEEQRLHAYAWIDPDKGIVQIPVERAMDLVVERGLPVTPAPPAGKTK